MKVVRVCTLVNGGNLMVPQHSSTSGGLIISNYVDWHVSSTLSPHQCRLLYGSEIGDMNVYQICRLRTIELNSSSVYDKECVEMSSLV